MFKPTTELINISHFNVLEADHFTVQLKEGFIQKTKKVLKVGYILRASMPYSRPPCSRPHNSTCEQVLPNVPPSD